MVLHDGQFAALSDRINQSTRRTMVLDTRIESCFDTIDRRLEQRDTRVAQTNDRATETTTEVTEAMRAALVATMIVTGICLATVVVATR